MWHYIEHLHNTNTHTMTIECDPPLRAPPQRTCDQWLGTIGGKRSRHLDNYHRQPLLFSPSRSQLSSKQSCHVKADDGVSSSRSSQITTATTTSNNLDCTSWSLLSSSSSSSYSLTTTCRRRQYRTWSIGSTMLFVGPLICIFFLSVLVQAHWQENLIPRRRISHLSKCI